MVGASLGYAVFFAAIATVEGTVDFSKPTAPPAPDGCRETLKTVGVRFTPWALRPSPMASGTVCEAPRSSAAAPGYAFSR